MDRVQRDAAVGLNVNSGFTLARPRDKQEAAITAVFCLETRSTSLAGKIFSILISLLVVYAVGREIVSRWGDKRFIWDVWKRFRPLMFVQTVIGIVVLIVVGSLLMQVPGLDFGWGKLLMGKSSNVVAAPLESMNSSYLALRLFAVVFALMLIVAAPFLAHAEEKAYRSGYLQWGPILKQSLKFGLIHLIMGIPIAFGLALSVSGLFFAWKYKSAYERTLASTGDEAWAEREGLMHCTAYHTMHNTIVFSLLLAFALTAL